MCLKCYLNTLGEIKYAMKLIPPVSFYFLYVPLEKFKLHMWIALYFHLKVLF